MAGAPGRATAGREDAHPGRQPPSSERLSLTNTADWGGGRWETSTRTAGRHQKTGRSKDLEAGHPPSSRRSPREARAAPWRRMRWRRGSRRPARPGAGQTAIEGLLGAGWRRCAGSNLDAFGELPHGNVSWSRVGCILGRELPAPTQQAAHLRPAHALLLRRCHHHRSRPIPRLLLLLHTLRLLRIHQRPLLRLHVCCLLRRLPRLQMLQRAGHSRRGGGTRRRGNRHRGCRRWLLRHAAERFINLRLGEPLALQELALGGGGTRAHLQGQRRAGQRVRQRRRRRQLPNRSGGAGTLDTCLGVRQKGDRVLQLVLPQGRRRGGHSVDRSVGRLLCRLNAIRLVFVVLRHAASVQPAPGGRAKGAGAETGAGGCFGQAFRAARVAGTRSQCAGTVRTEPWTPWPGLEIADGAHPSSFFFLIVPASTSRPKCM